MVGRGRDVGVDLGTTNTLVYVKGKGIVIAEPSVVALSPEGRLLAYGRAAHEMLGRTPESVIVSRPLKDGVIAQFEATEAMLAALIQRAVGRQPLFRPRVMICVPANITSVERRAVLQAGSRAGAQRTYLIEEPMAAAIGAGLDACAPVGSMVVDIGGGTTDVAVISLCGIVASRSLRVGGDAMDDALTRFVKSRYNLIIGERTAEAIKIQAATVHAKGRQAFLDIRGRDTITGLPRTVRITSAETREALKPVMDEIVHAVKAVLERTPPELSADIIDRGIVLTGGGSLLDGVDRLLADETGVPVIVAESPLECVARGTGRAFEMLKQLAAVVDTDKG